MLNQKQQRMLKLLEETSNHYNTSNRSHNETACLYVPDEGSNSEGCAVGRYLTEKHREYITALKINDIGVRSLFNMFSTGGVGIPKVFEDISIHFLIQLQGLHDRDEYWNRKGLSKEGKVQYNRIVTSIKNQEY